MAKISVLIVNWNVSELFEKCVKSVLDTKYSDLELILIDNDSHKKPKIPQDPRVIYIQNKSNLGFPAAVNQGLKLFTGDYVLILNPDTQLSKNFFTKAISFLNTDSEIGVMGPRFVDPDSTPQGSVFLEPSVLNTLKEYWFGQKGLTEKYVPTVTCEVNAVSGACMFMSSLIVKKVGLFTDKVFMYYEDLDYCRRIRNLGYKVVFNSEIEIVHAHGQSSKQNILSNKYLSDASVWYNGKLKHSLLWFIIWTSQKIRKIYDSFVSV
jgi:GT2 family glycosyltransferase